MHDEPTHSTYLQVRFIGNYGLNFETERMLKALNKNPDGDVKDILRNVRTYIDEFVGDAPQFDAITMLCFRYYGPEGKKNN